jgi:hypothetical protein
VIGQASIGAKGKQLTATTSYYTQPGGGGVFATGSCAWICYLDIACNLVSGNARTEAVVRQMTTNVVRAAIAGPMSISKPSTARGMSKVTAVPAPPTVASIPTAVLEADGRVSISAPLTPGADRYVLSLTDLNGRVYSSPTLSAPQWNLTVPAGTYTPVLVPGTAGGYTYATAGTGSPIEIP